MGSDPAGSPASNRELVRTFYERIWNRWNTAAVPEFLSSEIRFRGSLGLEKRGHAGFIEYVQLIRGAFPDFHNTIEELVAEGNRVAARLTYRGTHRGPIFGVAPTNRRIEYAGAAMFTCAGGKIARAWVLGDMHALMRQIGEG